MPGPQPTPSRILGLESYDVRFPTSLNLDGSDAMNRAPDYSAAYLVLRTNDSSVPAGYGFVFTNGRGNDLVAAAIEAISPYVVGRDLDSLTSNLGGLWRELLWDSSLRWLGPEKGIMHMAIGAVVNAAWDLAARQAGKPLWRLLAEMSPAQILDLIDFRYVSDALSPDDAAEILERGEEGKAGRIAYLVSHGYPAYATSPGWLGYSDEELMRRLDEAKAQGFKLVKLKVGANLEDDRRRLSLTRSQVGDAMQVATDANQVWGVETAISWVRELQQFDLAWIEEPTSPDDILGHQRIRQAVSPTPVATGEHVANRVVFKQLLQASAIDVMQIDACRVSGVNENIMNLLLAAKFGVVVCPHAGGVGLCEVVRHLSFFDYCSISRSLEGRHIEWIDHLHEHFVDPARVEGARYLAPMAPGISAELKETSVAEYRFPDGPVWRRLNTR